MSLDFKLHEDRYCILFIVIYTGLRIVCIDDSINTVNTMVHSVWGKLQFGVSVINLYHN